MAILPKASTPLVQANGLMTPEWYRLFQTGFGEVNGLTGATGTANTMPGNNTGSAAPDVRLTASDVKAFLDIDAADVDGLADVATTGDYSDLTGSWTMTFDRGALFLAPTATTYTPFLDSSYGYTVVSLSAKTSSGFLSFTISKNGTAITGLSGTIITTEGLWTATAGNVFSAGDDLSIAFSSLSSPVNVSMKFRCTRVLP